MADGDRWTSKWRPAGAADDAEPRHERSGTASGGASGGGDAWGRNRGASGVPAGVHTGPSTGWQRSRGNSRGEGSAGSGSDRPAPPQQPHRDHDHPRQGYPQQQTDGWRRGGQQRHDSGAAGGRQDRAQSDHRQPHGGGHGRAQQGAAPLDAGAEAADDAAAEDMLQAEFGGMGLGDGLGFGAWAGASEAAEGAAGQRGSAPSVPDEPAALANLEAAVASGAVAGWSLEELGRAAASLTDVWDVRHKPAKTRGASGKASGWQHHPFQVCSTQREAAVASAIGAAAICAAASLQQHNTPQQAQAVARLLRLCARVPDWSGPGEAAVASAWRRRCGGGGGAAGSGSGAAAALADERAWPGLSSRAVPGGAPAPFAPAQASDAGGEAADSAGAAKDGPAAQPPTPTQQPPPPYAALGQAMVAELAADDCRLLTLLDSQHAARVAWSLSRAGVLASLVGADMNAHAGSYAKKLLASLDEGSGCGRGEAEAAAAMLSGMPAALLEVLRARCRALMTEATVQELCGMSFVSADSALLPAGSSGSGAPDLRVGSSAEAESSLQAAGSNRRLLADLAADALREVASRLEAAVFLGLEVMSWAGSHVMRGNEPRMRTFLPRELACVAFSAGKLGLRADLLARLLTALSEYLACSHGRLPWSASTLGIFVCGVSKLVAAARAGGADGGADGGGGSQELRRSCAQLLEAVESCVLALRRDELDPRSISFLLSYLGRMSTGHVSRHVEAHLLGALLLHSPAALEPRNACHLLFGLCSNGPAAAGRRGGGGDDGSGGARSRYMAFEGGVARQDPMLAHLCSALAAAPARRLAPADVCMAVTSLSRLHGGKVLASQVPEVVAALENLAEGVARRGFGAGADDDLTAVPFTCREVSNFIVALAQLKFYSPGVMAALRDHAAAGGLDRANSWDTSALLYGLAWLNYDWRDGVVLVRQGGGGGAAPPPPPGSPALAFDLVGLLADAVVRRGRAASSQDLANALWGLAVMEGALDRYRGAVKALVAEANARGPHNFHSRDLKQVWPVERELRALPVPYTRLSDDMVRAGRLNSSECDLTFSQAQGDLNRTITAMISSGRWPCLRDLQFEQELVPGGDMLMKIDVQVTIERRGGELARVAVEFDGPFHFMVNEPYCWRRVDGRTALRDRVLARHLGGTGNVVVVNMEEWVAASRAETHRMPGRWRLLADKLGLAPDAGPTKERRLDDSFPKWEDHNGYTILKLAHLQTVLFLGEATLQVLNGAVRVGGKLVGVESPPLVLSTGGRFSLAISITAEAPVAQAPLAASAVVEVSLQSRSPLPSLAGTQPSQQQQQQQAGAAGGAGKGGARDGGGGGGGGSSAAAAGGGVGTFSLFRSTDAAAPPPLLISREMDQAVEAVCAAAAGGAPVVVAVLGPKGAGKSSLARLTANRLLDVVPTLAFLDSDVGQPEFSPPGLLSLHLLDGAAPTAAAEAGAGAGAGVGTAATVVGGPVVGPPHAHSRPAWASRFVGDVSPQHDPQLYLSAVQALYGSYWGWAVAEAAAGRGWPPLVVNTHGWVKGLGFDLLTQLLRLVAPTHAVQVRGGPEKKNLPRGAFWCEPVPAAVPGTHSFLDQQQQQQQQPAALLTVESLAGNAMPAGGPTSSGGGAGPTASMERQGSVQVRGGGRGGGGVVAAGGGGGPGGAGAGAGAAAVRCLKPVESRALAWHAWAKRVVGSEPAWGSYESDDFWRNAGALAGCAPWRVSLDEVHVQLLAGSLAAHHVGRLLNGAVVGLLATQHPPLPPPPPPPPLPSSAPARSAVAAAAAPPQHPPPGFAPLHWGLDEQAAAAAYPPGRVSYAGASASSPPPLLPCVGLAIVRAVDMEARCLYLLTDAAPELLQCVGALVVGRLELPPSLVVGGEVAWPYSQLFGLSAEATGAGAAGRARKNLSRSSLVELAG
ncbi:hypothetical protein HXX76_002960 [Chlamydomonas incerta]|uniref:Clp1 P-loop domain-containing protein n=1 Tax=Chlamydomonas incerta TaxID=51695 RepID=A0A835TPH8_CHLIN|nr:hypothetical protein HXX76_002960 [Chlamydomonas incerta]|eukprot:KAG2442881.1 hypothetical protein HXX76_002960 [Chlamydomonas incerta]